MVSFGVQASHQPFEVNAVLSSLATDEEQKSCREVNRTMGLMLDVTRV